MYIVLQQKSQSSHGKTIQRLYRGHKRHFQIDGACECFVRFYINFIAIIACFCIIFCPYSLDDLTKSEENNFQLLFAVSSIDDSYLWKAFVRVTCCKVSRCFDYSRGCLFMIIWTDISYMDTSLPPTISVVPVIVEGPSQYRLRVETQKSRSRVECRGQRLQVETGGRGSKVESTNFFY